MIRIAPESPLAPDGRALIAESQRLLEQVFAADAIFTLTAEELAAEAAVFLVARDARETEDVRDARETADARDARETGNARDAGQAEGAPAPSGEALGCVALLAAAGYGEAKRLMVRPSARGRGVGRALMLAVEAEARARDLDLMRIETGPGLDDAIALYRAMDYRETGPFGDYAAHPASLFLEKRLIRSGRCLCGAVRFRAGGEALWQAHCHCESCRRATASPVTTFFAVADGGWRWAGAAPARFASSPAVTRFFCPTCGTPMGYRHDREAAGEMHFYCATLDDPADVTPERHDFWEERLPWLLLADRLPR